MSGGPPLGSTYRLQLNGLGFERASGLVPYLSELGIQTLYASPILAASEGSTHGYDVIDPTRLDPSLGTAADYEALLQALDEHGMGLLIDAVPNHMAAEPANRWWWDVLAFGRRSAFADVFDIDWESGGGRVLLATLEAPLGQMLAGGLVHIDDGGSEVEVAGSQRFPVDPKTVAAGLDGGIEAVLGRQHYRLAFWRLGRLEGNYRRFFDVDGLVGVRVEDPAVYEETQRRLLELAADRRVAGLRLDHIDGLSDPAAFLRRLRGDLADRRGGEPPVIVVEKILGRDEWLPADLAADGTTGYEFADVATRLFIDAAGAAALERLGQAMSGDGRDFYQLSVEARGFVIDELFAGQLARLARIAHAALAEAAPGSDLAVANLAAAVRALIAHLDVYRTYIGAGSGSGNDRSRLEHAARRASPSLRGEDARALGAVLGILECVGLDAEAPSAARRDFVVRFEQLSGAVAAKGVEDTASYRYCGLLATAEVGGDAMQPALDPKELHEALARRARRSPRGLNALSTHDTKRSADVRARLATLSEVAPQWERLVARWHRLAQAAAGPAGLPDPHDELFFYQSLLGLWPLSPGTPVDGLRDRLQTVMRKAAREAKVRTSWLDPDESYEAALADFVDAALDEATLGADLDRLLRRIGPAAVTNSLAMVVLAATAPGVPDLYQGSETWQLALMDPDNRHSVDFGGLASTIGSLSEAPTGGGRGAEVATLLRGYADGRVKLFVTRATLHLRRHHAELFDAGAYLPLEVRGPQHDHLVAFARHRRRRWVVVLVPRLTLSVAGPSRFALGPQCWGGTRVLLPEQAPARLVDALCGGEVSARRGTLSAGDALSILPVGVFASG